MKRRRPIGAAIERPTYWAILPTAFDPAWIGPRALAGRAPRLEEAERYALVDGVAIVDVAGPLTKSAGWSGPGMQILTRQVQAAAADGAVNAILLRIDSPGGTVAGVSDLSEAVYAARKQKPVVSYISDTGASAAYHVAAQADRIYSDTDALVGSIGTYMVVPDFSQWAEANGVKVHVIRAGAMKGAGVPGAPVTEEHLADFQRTIDEINETFLAAVARGRGMKADVVRELADGRVHVGANAAAVGLTDGVRPWDDVLNEVRAQSLGQLPRDMSWSRVAGQPS